MAEENVQQSDTLDPSDPSQQPQNQELEARAYQDWEPQDSPSGSDPGIEDDLVAQEKEFRKVAQGQGEGNGDPSSNPDEREDELENPENLLAQTDDPAAQES
jgi:hypothetical protein